jgi:hypothetical protein
MPEIKNKELELTLEVMINKSISKVNIEDLSKIKDITLNAIDMQGNLNSNDLEDLKIFPKLEICTIRNYKIDDLNYESLAKLNNIDTLQKLRIYDCKFEKKDLSINIDNIEFISCNNLSIGEIIGNSNIKQLNILHCQNFNLKKLNKLKKIYFEDDVITKDIINELLNSSINEIVFNNCDFKLFANNLLKRLVSIKNVQILDKNKIV